MTYETQLTTQVASSFWKRLIGLKGATERQRLIIPKCRAIHTFGMKHSLHIQCLDTHGNILKEQILKPGKILIGPKGTCTIVEQII